jgi:tetratricopeptide (TPR) repeat protein
MKNTLLLLLPIILFAISCNTSSTEGSLALKEVTEESIQSIISDLKESNTIDKEKVSELIRSIDAFANSNPKNKNTPQHLELKAKYLGALGNNKEAIKVYNNLYNNFKSSENSSDALFMMAFLYENNIGDKEKAKEFYKKYLEEFPTKDFAKDAKFSLDNIDKTPEELMEMFNKQNAETTAQ